VLISHDLTEVIHSWEEDVRGEVSFSSYHTIHDLS
jgi:hypothetical protein